MRSKRTTSVCSSSTRTSRDDLDEVDNPRDSDDDDDEDEDELDVSPKVEIPVTYEYVYGQPSTVINYKLPKSSEASTNSTINIGATARNGGKISNKSQQASAVSKRQLSQQSKQPAAALQVATVVEKEEESEEEECESVVTRNLLLRMWGKLLLFIYNRSKLSTQEESLIIVLGIFIVAFIVASFFKFILSLN